MEVVKEMEVLNLEREGYRTCVGHHYCGESFEDYDLTRYLTRLLTIRCLH